MKSQSIRIVTASFLCLCALTELSGCTLFNFKKLVQKSLERNEEEWRKLIEAQQNTSAPTQHQLGGTEPQKAAQSPPPEVKVEPSLPPEIHASTVGELAEKAVKELGSRNDIVMVMFVARGDINATHAAVKDAMHSRDTQAVISPYWVLRYPGEALDARTRCGIVLGQWYEKNFPYRTPWELIMDGVLERETLWGTYRYSRNGEFALAEGGQVEMDALQEICFADGPLPTVDFSEYQAEASANGFGSGNPRRMMTRPSSTYRVTTAQDRAATDLKGDAFEGSACSNTLSLKISVTDVFLNNPKEQNDPLFLVRGVLTVTRASTVTLQTDLVGAISRAQGAMMFTASRDSGPRWGKTLISLFRDDNGIGWEGMLEGLDDNSCSDVHIKSISGKNTNAFPKMTGEVALQLSHPQMAPTSTLYPVYWLKVAETRGSIDATYYLGDLYEQRGKTSPEDYVRAAQYYQIAAQHYHDARAQAALGRMYKRGLGTEIDPAKAKEWNAMARKTRQAAAKVCASPLLKDALKRYVERLYHGNKKKVADGKALTGITMDLGGLTIGKVSLDQVSSLTHPFLCRAKAGLENPNVQMEIPESRVTVWRDQYGRETYTDNSIDQLSALAMPLFMNHAARNSTQYHTLFLDPLGNGQYTVTFQGQTEMLKLQ